MSGLEEAFYIVSIIYMSVMFLLIIGLVIEVFIIRSKVMTIQHQIQTRIDQVTDLASVGGELVGMAGAKITGAAVKKVARAIKKK
jgi:cell division protein FtsL